jgi:hypothetical protein
VSNSISRPNFSVNPFEDSHGVRRIRTAGATKEENRHLVFPPEAMVGSLGDFARVMAAGTEVPDEFYFACGLTFLGAAATNRLRIKAAIDSEPRIYTLLVGESADVKKSTALRRTAQFFDTVWSVMQPIPHINWGVGSAEGLARKLTEAPGRTVVLAFDEMQSFIEKTKVQASVLLPMVASLYEQTSWDNATKVKSSVSLRDAHLSLVGCCTTDTYERMWTPEAIAIGFPNRLFVVSSEGKTKVAWPKPRDQRQLNAVHARLQKQLARLPLEFGISHDAKPAWTRWYETLSSSVHAKRLDTIGFRLLGLIALTTDKKQIDLETVNVVTRILTYELELRILTDPVDADDRIARLEQRIRRQLKARKRLTVRELRRHTNADRAGIWAFTRALKNVCDVGDVVRNGDKTFSLRSD